MTSAEASAQSGLESTDLSSAEVRSQFAVLRASDETGPESFAYLDSAATTLLPDCVLESWRQHYSRCGGSLGRGAHRLSRMAADEFERAKATLREFFGVGADSEIVFVKSATEGFNLLAHGLKSEVSEGDIIVASELEHHSNLLPWRRLASGRQAVLERRCPGSC